MRNTIIKIRTHPIRFLLYFEWILLILVAVTEIVTLSFHPPLRSPIPMPPPRSPILNLFCLASLGAMGLWLPINEKWIDKIIYTGSEIGLILLAFLVGHIRMLPLMLIILVIRNCFLFKYQSRFLINGFAFILFLWREIERVQHLALRRPFVLPERLIYLVFSSTIVFSLVLIFLQLLVDAVLSERQSREKLAKANAQLRQYALRIEDIATLQERNRIARDIHDSLGHSLTVFNLHLEAVLRLWESEPAEAKELLREAKQLGSTALKEVRQSVATLRSDPLAGQSLEEAIASLTEDFHKSTGISPTYHLHLQQPIAAEVKIAAYRIVQEALTNIYKYAQATEVSIQIQLTTYLDLIIQDNGQGFNLEQNTTGFGLQGMRERTLALGGSFKIVTAPGAGCRIIAHLPVSSTQN
ncbi:MAG: sensor histidine kinase [Symploca sp. SIO2E6]|nr:sensor histidine kinase [Symploca sp. SIO2E6]